MANNNEFRVSGTDEPSSILIDLATGLEHHES